MQNHNDLVVSKCYKVDPTKVPSHPRMQMRM
jgi:hypothetical protein